MGRIAIAVDLGATSLRTAFGEIRDGELCVEIYRQVATQTLPSNGKVSWNIGQIEGSVQAALAIGQSFHRKGHDVSLGIDGWGVDIVMLDERRNILSLPVAYRDASHVQQAAKMAARHGDFFRRTGVYPHPFNTMFQLAARREEDSSLPDRASWLMIPEYLIDALVPGAGGHELTNASTTGLVDIAGNWCAEIFDEIGWPIPSSAPVAPGSVVADLDGVKLVRVATHDTASAVYGIGPLQPGECYLNLGTWGLLGTLLSEPLVSDAVLAAGFSNERGADGDIRFLKNIPGFHIINQLQDELGLGASVANWLNAASDEPAETFDCFHESLFAPKSMVRACSALLHRAPSDPAAWASVALDSLAAAILSETRRLGELIEQPIDRIKLAGGGVNCIPLIERIERGGLGVTRCSPEATLRGNMLMQLRATGDWQP